MRTFTKRACKTCFVTNPRHDLIGYGLGTYHGSLGELSKDFVDSSSNKRDSIDFSKTISINKSIDQDELKKSEKKMDFSDLDHSLKEFEMNEARTTKIEKEATMTSQC